MNEYNGYPSVPQSPASGPGAGFTSLGSAGQSLPDAQPAPKGRKARKASKAGAGGEPGPTRKIMNINRNIAIALAVVVGLLVLVVANAKPASVFVVRTKTALPPNAQLDAGALEAISVPKSLVEPGAFVADKGDAAIALAVKSLAGERAQYPIGVGSQLRADQFATGLVASTVIGPLKADERLVSIRAAISASVAGSLKPGDHVDVIATVASSNGSAVAGVVVSDVEVEQVAVSDSALNSAAQAQTATDGKSKTPQELLPSEPIGGTYVLRVPAAMVSRLAVVDSSALRVFLVYRPADAVGPNTTPVAELLTSVCSNTVQGALLPAACSPR